MLTKDEAKVVPDLESTHEAATSMILHAVHASRTGSSSVVIASRIQMSSFFVLLLT